MLLLQGSVLGSPDRHKTIGQMARETNEEQGGARRHRQMDIRTLGRLDTGAYSCKGTSAHRHLQGHRVERRTQDKGLIDPKEKQTVSRCAGLGRLTLRPAGWREIRTQGLHGTVSTPLAEASSKRRRSPGTQVRPWRRESEGGSDNGDSLYKIKALRALPEPRASM